MDRRAVTYLPLTADVIGGHLVGEAFIGLYPLLKDNTCHFLVADFDGPAAMLDALAYTKAARAGGVGTVAVGPWGACLGVVHRRDSPRAVEVAYLLGARSSGLQLAVSSCRPGRWAVVTAGEVMVSLVGRDAELRRFDALLAGVGERGAAVLLRGEAGIGKSALLAEFTARASAAGLRVLRTAGIESESHLQFAGLHQLLRPVRRDIAVLPAGPREKLTAALGLGEGVVPDAFLVALATLDLLSEVAARTPLLLVAEDAHWLDRGTANVVSFLARRLGAEPILMAAAVREGEPSRLDEDGIPEIVVPPLSRGDAETLLEADAPGLSDGVRRQLLDDAAGNPLALIELPRTVTAAATHAPLTAAWLPLTERLTRAFTARVATLPHVTTTALLVAALNDGESRTEIAAAVEKLTGHRMRTSDLAPAVDVRLIEVDGDEISFRHPLMRSAIRQVAALERRQAVHAALAEALDDPQRRVWHRAMAADPPDEELAAQLDAVASEALRRGGVAGAVAALEHGARLSAGSAVRADRLLRAADLAVELGRRDIVERLLVDAARLDLSPERRARLAWIRESFEDGLRDGATDALTLAELAESLVANGQVDIALRILWSAALRCFWTEPGRVAREHIVEVAERLPVDELDPQLVAILAYAAPIERGAVVIERIHRLATQVGRLDASAERLVGSAAVLVGSFDFARTRSAASVAGLRADGRLQLLARALAAQAWSAAHLVDLGTAIPAAEEASKLARETRQPYLHALVQATQAKVAALRGDLDAAAELAAAAERTGVSVVARPVLATAQDARALAALAAGDYPEAYARFARMHDPADPSYQLALRCHTTAGLADAAVRSGEEKAAAGIVADLEHAATGTTSASLHAGLRLARALLANDERVEDRFIDALRADLAAQPFMRAYTELAYGEWLRRQRRVAESRQPLRSARDTFDALGAIPWSARARRELRAAGEQSPSSRSSALDRLTAQELQIAQLAAEGLTNREIGQRLYLSHRTVGAHLAQVFPKLGVTSRAQLHGALQGAPA
jgi:DNA-binding CsgD family transcriptional regulator